MKHAFKLINMNKLRNNDICFLRVITLMQFQSSALVFWCEICLTFNSSLRNVQRASYRDNISSLCETTERISGLFSVADRRWAGLAKWRYNVSQTLNVCGKPLSLKYSLMVDDMSMNFEGVLFDVAVTALTLRMSFDCAKKPALAILSASELWKHGRTLREMCAALRSQCTVIKALSSSCS